MRMDPFSNPTQSCLFNPTQVQRMGDATFTSLMRCFYFFAGSKLSQIRFGDITDDVDHKRRIPSWWPLITICSNCVMQRTDDDCPAFETTVCFFEWLDVSNTGNRSDLGDLRFESADMNGMIRTCWPQFLFRWNKQHACYHPSPWMSLIGIHQFSLKKNWKLIGVWVAGYRKGLRWNSNRESIHGWCLQQFPRISSTWIAM